MDLSEATNALPKPQIKSSEALQIQQEIQRENPELPLEKLREFLDRKAAHYEDKGFIIDDPIRIPHRFSKARDVEVAAFLTAILAWGNRKAIVKSGLEMMELLDEAPYDFVKNHSAEDLKRLSSFVHRTFNGADLQFFIRRLRSLYQRSSSLQAYFTPRAGEQDLKRALNRFRNRFLGTERSAHAAKHLSNPLKNSTCKRLNLFLRWMVRSAAKEVDFGLWKQIDSRMLSLPLDVHNARVARKLGLLTRGKNDWKAVEELDQKLRQLDADDPVKYDFALFGLGIFEGL